jgi:hypothetical protein
MVFGTMAINAAHANTANRFQIGLVNPWLGALRTLATTAEGWFITNR